MRATRVAVATGGIALAVGAGLVALVPGLAAVVPVDSAVEAAGNEYLFVAAFGVGALVLLAVAVLGRGVSGLDQADPPAPEDVQSVPRAGSDLDDVVADGLGWRARLFDDRAEEVRGRLRDAAVTAEQRATNCSRDEARERVARGAWTDDREAAAFLGDERAPRPPVGGRLRALVSGRSWFQRGTRRTAERVFRTVRGDDE